MVHRWARQLQVIPLQLFLKKKKCQERCFLRDALGCEWATLPVLPSGQFYSASLIRFRKLSIKTNK